MSGVGNSGREALFRALVRDAAGFTPEITLDRPGPSAALASVVSRYGAIVGESLEQLPTRSRLAFADFTADAVQPATSARVPLVVEVLPDAGQNVVLPKGARFAARLPPPPPTLGPEAQAEAPNEAEFATDEQIALTSGSIAALYSIDPRGDVYADHIQAAASGDAVLFRGMRQAPHDLYIGHDTDLELKGQAEITIFLDVLAPEDSERRPILLDWSYLSKDGWFPLTTRRDETARLTRDGLVRLAKTCGPDAVEGEIGGRTSFWVRASVSDRRPRARGRNRFAGEPNPGAGEIYVDDSSAFLVGDEVTFDGVVRATVTNLAAGTITTAPELPSPPEGLIDGTLTLADALPPLRPAGTDSAGPLPRIDMLRLSVGFANVGLQPDLMAVDGQVLDVDRPFQPLGSAPEIGTSMFIACEQAFKRSGASIRILADLDEPGVPTDDSDLVIFVEYWNGGGWVQLTAVDGMRGAEDFFITDGNTTQPELRFNCPSDWEKSEIAGAEHLWLRLRVMSGSFGQASWTTVQDGDNISVTPTPDSMNSPVMSSVRLSYVYSTERALPDHCLSYNDFVYTDQSFDVRWRRRPFYPFTPTSDRAPALHLGLTEKPPVGLVSLLVTVPTVDAAPTAEPRPFVFEYRSSRGWSELAVLDGTEGFTRTGLLQFIGPGDAVAAQGLGGDLFRIRARLKRGQRIRALDISGIWTNGVWSTQSAAVRRTVLGTSDGTAGQLFRTPPTAVPILSGAKIELREWQGRGADWETTVSGVPDADIRIERDPVDGETPVEVWVAWSLKPHLAGSGPSERHLVLDAATGFLRAGDGVRGLIPPAGAEVAMTWQFGGMVAANVDAGMVNEVRSTTTGISGVTNPVAASGAAAKETQARLMPRSAARFMHRFRAVRPEDYAWLAREATPELARAVARPVTGQDGTVLPGKVELVLVPQNLDPRPMPSQTLRARVQTHLAEAMPVGVERGLRLVAPRYGDISVVVRAELTGGGRAGATEAAMRRAIDAYLHALHGGPTGDGWTFGATLRLSNIASVLAAVDGVGSLQLLRWLLDGALEDETLELPDDHLPAPGDHQITLTLEEEV